MQLNSSDLSSPSNLIIFWAPLLSTFQITLQKKKKTMQEGQKWEEPDEKWDKTGVGGGCAMAV